VRGAVSGGGPWYCPSGANAILLARRWQSCQEISVFLYLDDDTIPGLAIKPTARWLGNALALPTAGRASLGKVVQSRMSRKATGGWVVRLAGRRVSASTVEIKGHICAEVWFGLLKLWLHQVLATTGFLNIRKPKPLPRPWHQRNAGRFFALYEKLMREFGLQMSRLAGAVHGSDQACIRWVKVGSNPSRGSSAAAGRGRGEHLMGL